MGSIRQPRKGAKTSPDDSPGEDAEAVEVTAQISVPKEGGWGWVVVLTSSIILGIVDGNVFSFGSILIPIAKDLKISITLSSLINSMAVLFYYSAGPIASALINRFGFRSCTMFGSVLSSITVFLTYFVESYVIICILYGMLTGFGYCCIQMSATLVVGFYFEKLRSLVLSLTLGGSCIGVILFSPANAFIATKCSWRTVLLLQAGLLGICYFLAMTFRPLLSVTVITMVDDQPSRSTVILPSTSRPQVLSQANKSKQQSSIFSGVGNKNFPTAAQITAEMKPTPEMTPESSGVTSKRSVSKVTLRPTKEISKMQLKQLHVIKSDIQQKAQGLWIDIEEPQEPVEERKARKKRKLFDMCCPWETHVSEHRPLYRDDVFYEGSIKNLPIYQSVTNKPENEKTGVDYQLAVSRAATVKDLKENKGFFPPSIRRVLATMLDLSLLKRWSFFLMCLNGFIVYMAFIVPFLFAVDRAIAHGLNPELSKFLISGMNLSVLIGRLLFAYLGNRFDPFIMFIMSEIACGVSLLLSNLYFTMWYQFFILILYGFFSSSLPTLRSLVLVQLYGIEKLTNAMGIKLVFCGFGCSIGGPFVMVLNDLIGISVEFYFGGLIMIIAALLLIPASKLAKKENAKLSDIKIQVIKTPVVDPNTKPERA